MFSGSLRSLMVAAVALTGGCALGRQPDYPNHMSADELAWVERRIEVLRHDGFLADYGDVLDAAIITTRDMLPARILPTRSRYAAMCRAAERKMVSEVLSSLKVKNAGNGVMLARVAADAPSLRELVLFFGLELEAAHFDSKGALEKLDLAAAAAASKAAGRGRR